MTLRIAIHHHTRYLYDHPVSLSPHVFRLRPAAHCRTPIEAYSLRVKPEKHFINWQQDPSGNFMARIVFLGKSTELSVDVDIVADMTVINPFDFFIEEYATHYPFEYEMRLNEELNPYLKISENGPLLQAWIKEMRYEHKPEMNDFLVMVNQRLNQSIRYLIRMEPGVQSCETTLEKGCGSCRDSAFLLVQIMRHLGLAARFVSGYLVQLKADMPALDGPSGPEQDFTDLHAWCEVYIPGAGWIGLDPTSGLFAGEGHIPLACTPEPASAAPISGNFWPDVPTGVSFEFRNHVQRIHEDPRVTLPYSEDQWACIDRLGSYVDQRLQQSDVRLTMGGEPTFVSIDDMESPEWNTAALGEKKRQLAGDLLLRLREAFAPGGVLHYGQGKWYPGELLPRWALECYWRSDGLPLWRDEQLLALDDIDYHCTVKQTEQFARDLSLELGISDANLIPAFEDIFHALWEKDNLPPDLDPLKAAKDDSIERRHLAEMLSRGLDVATGYALPLRWDDIHKRWQSVHWHFRRETMMLIPGESPMGFRLPLSRVRSVSPEERQRHHPVERSLFDSLPDLGDSHGEIAKRYSYIESEALHPEIEVMESADMRQDDKDVSSLKPPEMIYTALCIELRHGVVHIFLPPLDYLEHYLDLLTCIEKIAGKLRLSIRLEGYSPPVDYRLKKFSVTPDPGVIEVNVHPSDSWQQLKDITFTLNDHARRCRLGAEKFMLDGLHTGTGGGNHITLGGATPLDSPFLRRPDLLRSLITFWQHHPCMSYLFSGMFVGPTSQAPRIDEARDDALYELETAFREMPSGEVSQPWLIDRLLRNLLVDITGNTHRAEICIDKLYSPDSQSGRLGLVELRAFEMPPHERMSMVQMLLVRALVSSFWDKPYEHPLVRWGTALHDRFMLPHFLWQDLKEVILALRRDGYAFQLQWFAPFYEFRFPRYGSAQIGDIGMELRGAIEPWNVLGEEISQIGTARYVDSSVERLQVRLTGLTESRYVLSCGGRRVPLHPTGVDGEYVTGIRYRAWQPPSALHPTIGVHSPLVFDLIDTWNGRAIGGCTYHVAHPGGLSPEDFPVNAYAAETRRVSRFWNFNHTPGKIQPQPDLTRHGEFYTHGEMPGPMEPPIEEIDAEFPYTLDLRRRPY